MRRALILMAVWIVAIRTLADAGAGSRVSPPAGAALTDATKLVADAYKADISAAKTPEQKLALAQKLIDASKDEKGAAGRFALLSKARDLAVDSGTFKLADAAIAELDNVFDIDALKMLAEAVTSTAKSAQSPAQRQELVSGAGLAADKAMAADRYDIARSMAAAALGTARLMNDAGAKKAAEMKSQQVQEAEGAYVQVKKSLVVLADKPDDSEANLKVGTFRCFIKGDWEHGLPMLALGSDATLKALAANEAAGVAGADEEAALGDGWWNAASKLTGIAKDTVQQHAAKLYQEALPKLSGLAKTRVESRIKEAGEYGGGYMKMKVAMFCWPTPQIANEDKWVRDIMQAQHVPLELNPKAITEDTTVLIIGTNSYRDHRDLISGINVKEFIERGGTVIKFGEWGGEYAFMKCGVSGRRGGGSDVRITSAGKEVLGGYDGLSSYQSILEPERGLQFEALLVNDKKEVVGLKAQVGKGFLFCFGIEPGATADKPFMTSVMTHLLEQRPPQR